MTSKRKAVSLETKVSIIHASEKGQKQVDLCKEHSLSKSTIGTIIANKSKILKAFGENKITPDRKKIRGSNFQKVEEAVHAWYRQMRAKNLPVTGPILVEKATKFASEMNVEDFKASQGWLDNFKKRNNISSKVMAGECESVSVETTDNWKNDVLPNILENWDPKNVYNCDESGLFFKMLPNKTMHTKGEKCHGSKKSKERVTVMFCGNMDGSDKVKLTVIGKFKNPRCFKHVQSESLPVDYMAQKNAWMDSDIYKKWIQKFDNKMARQGRKVLLFMDNVSSHNKYDEESLSLKATEIKFFPPNTTSRLQPMDQGIIQACKVKYRHRLLQRMVADIEAGIVTKIDLKEAINILSNAWNAVSKETISNCFRKAGFHDAIQNENSESEVEISDGNEERRNLWDFINREFDVNPAVTLDSFLTVDDDLDTDGTNLTDQEIIEAVMSEVENEENVMEEDEMLTNDPEEENIKTVGEALLRVRQLRKFLVEKGIGSDRLDGIEDGILAKAGDICHQSKITQYFNVQNNN